MVFSEKSKLKVQINDQDFASDIQASSQLKFDTADSFHFVQFTPFSWKCVIRDYANSTQTRTAFVSTIHNITSVVTTTQVPIPVKMPRFSECWRCGKTGNSVTCRACDIAKYCSNACHRNDKFRHEAECKPVAIIKTCSSCRKSGSGLRACTGCYRVYYCDIKCQKSHRKAHKPDCSSTKDKIEGLVQRMFAYYSPRVKKVYPKHYYWGNYPAFDGVNLLENEGGDYSFDLKVLFLGVGDFRNVALSCALLPDTYGHVVMFTLNDRESCILARLVLFIYMLIKGKFNSDYVKNRRKNPQSHRLIT